jgi:hypothetical protein
LGSKKAIGINLLPNSIVLGHISITKYFVFLAILFLGGGGEGGMHHHCSDIF